MHKQPQTSNVSTSVFFSGIAAKSGAKTKQQVVSALCSVKVKLLKMATKYTWDQVWVTTGQNKIEEIVQSLESAGDHDIIMTNANSCDELFSYGLNWKMDWIQGKHLGSRWIYHELNNLLWGVAVPRSPPRNTNSSQSSTDNDSSTSTTDNNSSTSTTSTNTTSTTTTASASASAPACASASASASPKRPTYVLNPYCALSSKLPAYGQRLVYALIELHQKEGSTCDIKAKIEELGYGKCKTKKEKGDWNWNPNVSREQAFNFFSAFHGFSQDELSTGQYDWVQKCLDEKNVIIGSGSNVNFRYRFLNDGVADWFIDRLFTHRQESLPPSVETGSKAAGKRLMDELEDTDTEKPEPPLKKAKLQHALPSLNYHHSEYYDPGDLDHVDVHRDQYGGQHGGQHGQIAVEYEHNDKTVKTLEVLLKNLQKVAGGLRRTEQALNKMQDVVVSLLRNRD